MLRGVLARYWSWRIASRQLQSFGRGTEPEKLLSEITFTFPGAYHINIYSNSFARGADGSLAIIGTADTNDAGGIRFLACVSPDGQQTIVRLSDFFPYAATIATDGTIWVAGANSSAQHGQLQNLIRRYDKTGALLGSFIPWSTPQKTLPPPVSSSACVL